MDAENESTDESTDQAAPGMTGETKMQVEIIKSTQKAHLVQNAEGRQAWIQARWLRADGTVSDETFNKGAAAIEQNKADEAAAKEFNNGLHEIVEIAKESEKAIAINAHWENFASDQSGYALVWFPKSQVKNNRLPGWLLKAKAKELKERLTSQYTSFEIEINGFVFNV